MATSAVSDDANATIDADAVIELVRQMPSEEFFELVGGMFSELGSDAADLGTSSVAQHLKGAQNELDATNGHLAEAVVHLVTLLEKAGDEPEKSKQLERSWPESPEQKPDALGGDATEPGAYRRGVQAMVGQLGLSGPVTAQLRRLLVDYADNEATPPGHAQLAHWIVHKLNVAVRFIEATDIRAHNVAQGLGHAYPGRASSTTCGRRGVPPARSTPGARAPGTSSATPPATPRR